MDESFSMNNFCTDKVYDLATDIASEFENVVDRCGVEALRPVVLKVIQTLEYLEATVISLESSKNDILELRNQNKQLLSSNKITKTERVKLEQDLEELQEITDREINNLKAIILKLRDDNKRLQEHTKQNPISNKDNPSISDECLIRNLKEAVSSLNVKLEEKNAELQEMTQNIIKLQSSIEELTKSNKWLCSKICEAEKKIHNFYEDESNLKQQITEQNKVMIIMERSLNEATQQKMDLEESLYSDQDNLLHVTEASACLNHEGVPQKLTFENEREKEMLLHRIHCLEIELSRAKSETESFQSQYLQLKRLQTEQRLIRPYSIRQLFHFVLGVISPISENFRSF